MKTTRWLLITLLAAGAADAQRGPPWNELAGRCGRCGYNSNETARCIGMLKQAGAEGLPEQTLLLKMQEALAKRVPAEALTQALERRAGQLRRADALLREQGFVHTNAMRSNLQETLALAFESGVTQEEAAEPLKAAGGRWMPRLTFIIGAGEAMKLAGVPSDVIREAMAISAETGLMRSQVQTLSSQIIEAHKQGKPAADLMRMIQPASATTGKP